MCELSDSHSGSRKGPLVPHARFDIHGFLIEAYGPVVHYLRKEYGLFEIGSPVPKQVSLVVEPVFSRDWPTTPAGSLRGMYLPFDQIESSESGTILYDPDVDLYVLASYIEGFLWWRDKTLLHAGAVSQDSLAYVFTGGGGVGKTSVVMWLIRNGFEYLSDDWLIVGNGMAYPFPKTIHLFGYNLSDSDLAKRALGRRRHLAKVLNGLLSFGERVAPSRELRYACQMARPRYDVPLEKIFPEAKIARPSKIRGVFFLERTSSSEVRISEASPAELARRMSYVNQFERHYFYREYYKYSFTRGIRCKSVEERFDHEFKQMLNTFTRAHCFKIGIPRGYDILREGLSLPLLR